MAFYLACGILATFLALVLNAYFDDQRVRRDRMAQRLDGMEERIHGLENAIARLSRMIGPAR